MGQIDTPNGRLVFLEVIGITKDEHDLVAQQGANRLLTMLLRSNPLAVVDINRQSLSG